METFLLVSLIAVVLFFMIYTSFKTKKIYSENIEYESKNEDEIKRIEKRLALKGFKFKTIQKYEYYYILNGTTERVLLPRIRIYWRKFKKYGLIINNDQEMFKDNILLKKQAMEFLNSKKIQGIIVFNEKHSNFDFVKLRKDKTKQVLALIILALILVILYFSRTNVFLK